MSRLALVVPVLILALAGCSAPTPEPSSSPVPTPTEAAPAAPTTRFDLACEDLDVAALTPTLPEGATLSGFDLVAQQLAEAAAHASLSYDFFIEAVGGLSCSWSTASDPATGASVRLFVKVLPGAEAQWQERVAAVGEHAPECPISGTGCELEALVGEYWVSALYQNAELQTDIAGAPAVSAFFESLLAEVESLPASRPLWSPRSSTRAIPTDCDLLLSASDVGAALGVSGIVLETEGQRQLDGRRAAMTQAGAANCAWFDGGPSSLAMLLTLPGGAWAEERWVTLLGANAQPVELAGLGQDDRAFAREGIVDLFVDGNWIEVHASDNARVLDLAAAVLASAG